MARAGGRATEPTRACPPTSGWRGEVQTSGGPARGQGTGVWVWPHSHWFSGPKRILQRGGTPSGKLRVGRTLPGPLSSPCPANSKAHKCKGFRMNPRRHSRSPPPDGIGEGTGVSRLNEVMKGSPVRSWGASRAALDPQRDTDVS